MIKFIAAIDSKKGLADDNGIPWDLPKDKSYFRAKTEGGEVLMGYRTYQEFSQPLGNRQNYVLTKPDTQLRPGFKAVEDTQAFFKKHPDIWVIGGAGLFAQTIDSAEELYLTHLDADFHCTKFFPDYEKDFRQVEISEPQTENGITFRFARYERKNS